MAAVGQIRAIRGNVHEVHQEGATYRCGVRKKLKRSPREGGKIACVGDRVEFTPGEEGEGVIESFLPRETRLSRRDPQRPEYEQVIVANVDVVVGVQAAAEPALDFAILDRCAVMAEAADMSFEACINKMDLAPPGVREAAAGYAALGYGPAFVSARSGEGLDDLRRVLHGRTCVLLGPSGVGKSSLLNALDPGRGRKTREVSDRTGEGRHTTSWAELTPVAGGMVADTPGMEFFTLWGIDRKNLPTLFPEFDRFLGKCRFNDCRHSKEPGCAVGAAADRGEIVRTRYDSYLAMWAEVGETEWDRPP